MPKSDPLLQILERLAEVERRQANILRKVKVKENKDGKVIVEDGTGFVSDELSQVSLSAGGWKIDAPADAGAQGLLFSPDGDPANGTFLPCLPDDDHEAASTKTDTLKLISPAGKTITINDDGFYFKGDVKIDGNFRAYGDVFTHNDKNTGFNHNHKDVKRGVEHTGDPV
jgi:hypothetical protein